MHLLSPITHLHAASVHTIRCKGAAVVRPAGMPACAREPCAQAWNMHIQMHMHMHMRVHTRPHMHATRGIYDRDTRGCQHAADDSSTSNGATDGVGGWNAAGALHASERE